MAMKPQAKSIGTLRLALPRAIVALESQLFTAVGMTISVVQVANRDCASGGAPPATNWKKCAPRGRSSNSMTLAAVRLGIAKSSRKAVIRVIHVNNGIRLIVIPGARILRIVTTKLSEPAIEEIPRRSIPSSQKSSFKAGVHMTALPQFEVSSLKGA